MQTPTGLAENGADLWASITDKFDLRVDELHVLSEACREVDLIDKMVTALSATALMTLGSMGQPVVHPLVSEIRQHRTVLAALLRSLKLPDEDGGTVKMNQQRQAGNASWAKRSGRPHMPGPA